MIQDPRGIIDYDLTFTKFVSSASERLRYGKAMRAQILAVKRSVSRRQQSAVAALQTLIVRLSLRHTTDLQDVTRFCMFRAPNTYVDEASQCSRFVGFTVFQS